MLELLSTIARHGWQAVNPSMAVLYRKITVPPTLLFDEMDGNYRAATRTPMR